MSRSISFLATLRQLRWLAAAGQAIAILVAVHALDLPFAQAPLWSGVAALIAANLVLRSRPGESVDAAPARIVAHLAFDVGVLAWQIAFSGGLSNPFVSLFLLPIALGALVLQRRLMLVIAAVAVSGFGAAVALAPPVVDPHAQHRDLFGLHLAGMVANFLLSVGVIVVFMDRLSRQLRRREAELADARERAIRDEGILGLATHAASLAHELNTPLGSMTLLLDDLGEDPRLADDLRDEVAQLSMLTGQCRDRVRALAQAGEQFDGPLATLLPQAIGAWQLLRPEVDCAVSMDIEACGQRHVHGALRPLLQVLLNNAADASLASDSARVWLSCTASPHGCHLRIEDEGDGRIARPGHRPALFRSDKPDGLGIGLSLAQASVDRHGGKFVVTPREGQGTCIAVFWPWSEGMAS
jgi:two-component system sensor histidine kinase RegB